MEIAGKHAEYATVHRFQKMRNVSMSSIDWSLYQHDQSHILFNQLLLESVHDSSSPTVMYFGDMTCCNIAPEVWSLVSVPSIPITSTFPDNQSERLGYQICSNAEGPSLVDVYLVNLYELSLARS